MNNKKYLGVIIVLALIATTAVAVAYNAMSNNNQSSYQDNSAQPDYSAAASVDSLTIGQQADCLDKAYKEYQSKFNAADTDGDGKVLYADGYTNIETGYYDAQISCYRTFKTNDSDGYITDLQAKRQQEVDKYNAWVSSLRPTYTAPTTPKPTHCTSYSYGIDDQYTSTNCY